MLLANCLNYSLAQPDGSRLQLLRQLDLQLEPGQLLGLVGGNGSGKSTLARLLNGLLRPHSGQVLVDDLDTADPLQRREVLARVGMVFQNPDAQLVATVVEEDVAFGPENHGMPPHEIRRRVEWALEAVGITELRSLSPQRLSGGQKQKVAIAAALAMSPRYLILDEPTSMLDPAGRRDFLRVIDQLKAEGRIGILFITHRLEELKSADAILFLDQGKICSRLAFSDLPSQRAALWEAGVALPRPMELSARLQDRGVQIPLAGGLEGWLHGQSFPTRIFDALPTPPANALFDVSGLGRIYGKSTPWEHLALEEVSFSCPRGGSLGLIGATGSGKSTLVQHLNGVLRPQSGVVRVGGVAVPAHRGDLGWLRRQVGLVFQNPEYQFFEETVAAEVGFGPRNFGLRASEVEEAVQRSLGWVGLDGAVFRERNPHELSGGEKRRVALASVLASSPQALVLDEPTAGLDARHRLRILDLLKNWQVQTGGTLVVISHELEDLAVLVERCLVLSHGHLVADDTFRQLLPRLPGLGLPLPWLPDCLLRHPHPPSPLPVLVDEVLEWQFPPSSLLHQPPIVL